MKGPNMIPKQVELKPNKSAPPPTSNGKLKGIVLVHCVCVYVEYHDIYSLFCPLETDSDFNEYFTSHI